MVMRVRMMRVVDEVGGDGEEERGLRDREGAAG